MKHAHHVLSDAHGPVHIRDSARCHAQHHVTVSHAMSAAPGCFLAVISALGYVEKIVFQPVAKSVG